MKITEQKNRSASMKEVMISRTGDSCVVTINYPDDAEVTLSMAREVSSEVRKRFGSEKLGFVHIAGVHTTIGEGVREYLSHKSAVESKIAEAFVVKNLNQRIIGNFYLRVGRPACPSEVFTSVEDAVKWVKMYCPRLMAQQDSANETAGQTMKNSANENTGAALGLHAPVQNFSAN